MVKFFLSSLLISVALFSSVFARDINVEYGVVTGVSTSTHKSDSSRNKTIGAAAGGILGGLLGLTSSRNDSSGDMRRRALLYGAGGALAGTGAGSLVGGSHKVTVYHYSVKLLEGNIVKITTEQSRIDIGDCVSVERGNTNNIRRVAQVLCDVPEPRVIRPQHRVEATECAEAKAELVNAQGSKAIDDAIRKVKVLCDD